MMFRRTNEPGEATRLAKFRRFLVGAALLGVMVMLAAGAFTARTVAHDNGGESRAAAGTDAGSGTADSIGKAVMKGVGTGQAEGEGGAAMNELESPSITGIEDIGEPALDGVTIAGSGEYEKENVYSTPGSGYVRFTPQVAAYNHVDYSNFQWWNLNANSGYKTGFQFGEFWAYRSDRYPSYTQRICIELLLFSSVGGTVYGQPSGWQREYDSQSDGPACQDLAPGQGPFVQQPFFRNVLQGRIYTAGVAFTWEINGTMIARRTIDFQHAGDYYCASGGISAMW